MIKAITCQQIEQNSCSNPLEMRKVLYFRLKKLGSFGFEFLVGGVMLGVGLGFFGLRHRDLGPNPKRQFFSLKKLGENPHL